MSKSYLIGLLLLLGSGLLRASSVNDTPEGNQRLSIAQLNAWEELGYGMFIHFGMSTFDNEEMSKGDKPSTYYNPTKVDVDQWVRTARDAGMKYAILTTKHVSGHCLWPSKYTDYHVGTSGNTTDVVREFVNACHKYGIMPGFYYCSWDNHHIMGSGTPTYVKWEDSYTSQEYQQFQWNQLEELLTQYGKIGEVWIDIPSVLSRDYRNRLYAQIAKWQPEAVIVMNHGIGNGANFSIQKAWPTDIITVERFLPHSRLKYVKWRTIENKEYYIPGEVCEPISNEWFYTENEASQPRSDEELLGMYLVARARGANFLLNVTPNKEGILPDMYIQSLMRLKGNIQKLGAFELKNK